MVAPLRLKRERFQDGTSKIAPHAPVLSVLVDTGVYHLDQEFDYLLPENLSVSVGDWVSVPFRNQTRIALVVNRSEKSNFATLTKLSRINKRAKGPNIAPILLQLYRKIAERYAVPIFDVLRYVVRFKDSEIDIETRKSTHDKKSVVRSYIQLTPHSDEISQVRAFAEKLATNGATLLIVPDARTAELLSSTKFRVSMRGGALTPKVFKNVIILREESELHYELKSPGFNTRDITLIRNEILGENLFFLGFSPSLEMMNLIAKGYVKLKKENAQLSVKAAPSTQGELIPSSLLKEVKQAAARGTVLILAAAKGYGLAISCAKCRNRATCKCGGRLTKRTKLADPICTICETESPNWRCSFCQSESIYLLGRGIERIGEEFGKSFPNIRIHIATADKKLPTISGRNTVVLSTIGAAPVQLYSAVLFLEGLNMGADLRSEERALSNLFRYASLANGQALVVERPESPLVNALIRWNPFKLLERQIEELGMSKLPPVTRHLLLKVDIDEADRIYSGIRRAISDERLSKSIASYNLGGGVISIFFPLKEATRTLAFFHELQRRRSISGKSLFRLRVDPYLLG